jgi:outer membrane protein OmpA-like peptidoglycan-associated protein
VFCLFIFPAESYAYQTDDNLVTLEGSISDLKTHHSVNADVDIFRNNDFVKQSSGKTNSGQFRASIKDLGWYIISISAHGYLDSTDTLWVTNKRKRTIHKDFNLAPIEVGLTVTLNNIYFNFGKTSISEQSFPELDKVVKLFRENDGVAFEIAGHTDSDGSEAYNQQLSLNRANSVGGYLHSQGVNGQRIVAFGAGEAHPVASNSTAEGKQQNRRVELKLQPIVRG